MDSPASQLRPGFVLGQWVRVLFDSLTKAGIEDVVISPGSRSTPLTMAALGHKSLRCHSVIDERSAGFFALGLARATGRTPLLICTSGSALTHYFPAVVEAYHSELPLLIASADRPSELWDCGAPQTIAQDGIFGSFAKSAPSIGEPSAEPDKLRALFRKVQQAVALSSSPSTGPVHLNIPIPKPLSPLSPKGGAELAQERLVASLCQGTKRSFMPRALIPEKSSRQGFLEKFDPPLPLLVTLGPIGPEEARAARDLSFALGAPCLSELPQAGAAAPLDFLASSLQAPGRHPRVRVLHVGPPCISSRWNELLKTDSIELHVLPGEQHRDPSNRAVQILQGRLLPLLKRLLIDLKAHPIDGSSNATFRSFIESTCSDFKNRTVAALAQLRGSGPHDLSIPEARAMACLLRELGDVPQVCVANSLTLRLACWIAPIIPQRLGPIFTARGTNGIDGWIAASAGTASSTQKPCVALIGDVTAAHDLGSLALLSKVGTPLVIVILDNSGGRIFDHLPAYDHWGTSEEWAFWRTPPGINWQSAAAAFQVPYARCDDEVSLPRLLDEALRKSQATILHVITDPKDTRQFIGLAGGDPSSP